MNARQFARAQQKPLGPIRKLLRAVLHFIGLPITPPQVEATAALLYRPVLRARDENYLAVVRYLHDEAPEILAPLPHLYTPQVLTATIESVIDKVRVEGEPVTEATRTDTRVIEQVRPGLEGPITRQVLDPARETLIAIGEDQEYASYGWARVLVGAYSCGFCAMLASRQPLYTSAGHAKFAASGKLFHTPHPDTRPGGKGGIVGGNCDCSVALVKRDAEGYDLPWEGQAAQRALEDLWLDATEGYGGVNARNAFRREWDGRIRRRENMNEFLPESLRRVA